MHPLPEGAPHWTQGYRELDLSEQRVMHVALEHFSNYAELWYRLIDLYVRGLRGETRVEDEEMWQPWEARSELLGLALGNSKAALDMALAGYYSGSYVLIRHLLETWEHVAFIRLEPDTAIAWYQQEGDCSTWKFEPGDNPRRKRLRREITLKGHLKIVERFWKEMSNGAHPTGKGLVQTMGEGAGRHVLGANFHANMALLALDSGVYANLLLLKEINQLKPQDENWIQQVHDVIRQHRELYKIHMPD